MPYAIERNNMEIPMQDETAKTLLDKTNSILIETLTELKSIDNAISGQRPDVKEPPISGNSEECLLTTLREQNRLSAEILEIARHIKGGLW